LHKLSKGRDGGQCFLSEFLLVVASVSLLAVTANKLSLLGAWLILVMPVMLVKPPQPSPLNSQPPIVASSLCRQRSSTGYFYGIETHWN
jgi:hypothetical protein